MNAGRVLVVGDVIIDLIVRAEGPPVPGSDRRARIEMRQGGSGANQAVWLAHFGAEVDFVGRVGAGDALEQEAIFRRAGVTPWLARDPDRQTGRLVALIDASGERSFLTDRAANEALEYPDIARAPVDAARLIHLSGYSFFAPGPREAVLATMARAAANHIPVSVDPASVSFLRETGVARFLASTAGARIIFPNADEAEALTGASDEDEQMRRLAALYPIAVVKRGARGAEMAEGDRRWRVAAEAVEALDATGAGDAFVGAFLACWLRGGERQRCLAEAVAAGSLATCSLGGRPASAPGRRDDSAG